MISQVGKKDTFLTLFKFYCHERTLSSEDAPQSVMLASSHIYSTQVRSGKKGRVSKKNSCISFTALYIGNLLVVRSQRSW